MKQDISSGAPSKKYSSAEDMIRSRYQVHDIDSHGAMKELAEDRKELPVYSPWDRRLISHVGLMTDADALKALKVARTVFLDGGQPKTHERIAILHKAAELLSQRADAFADLIAFEGGKPRKDADIEVARAVQSMRLAAEEAGRIHGEEIPMRASRAAAGRIAFTYPEPIGVSLAVSAFNHPLNLIVHQVAPAIAVGCPSLVKPALETPLTCLHLLEVLYEAGLPPAMAQPLIAENEVVEKIVQSPDVAFLNFIGSAKVGWYLRTRLAPGARFALEHGGSAPVLIDRSADLETAIPTLLRGAYYHSGQVCVSVQRVFIHQELLSEFSQRFVAEVQRLKVGDPRAPETDCGPIIRERDLLRMEETLAVAKAEGTKVLCGGERWGQTCFAPTVLQNAANQSRVMREEFFGPLAVLNPIQDLREGVRRANDNPWSFQAAVFSRDLPMTLQAVRGLNASAVMVNESTTFRVDWMPFRGDGSSGFGTGGVPFTMRDLVREKLVVIKDSAFEL